VPVHDTIELVRDTLSSCSTVLCEVFRRKSNGDSRLWTQLTASMDAVEDSQEAIDAFFLESQQLEPEDSSQVGQKYLRLYGLLQAMFLQQDAVASMLEAVGLGYDPMSDSERVLLKGVRTIRNQSVGHPTKYVRGKRTQHAFIVRASISPTDFEYVLWDPSDPTPEFVAVDLGALRSQQALAIDTALGDVDEHLQVIAKDFELGDLEWWLDDSESPG